MRGLVEFPLESGGTVLVQVEDVSEHPVTRGVNRGQDVAERTTKTFEEATASITPTTQSLIGRLRRLDDPPDEIGVEFGIQLSAEAGAFIASVAAEAMFKVTLNWTAHEATD
jgi:hypothetical protein